MSREEKTNYAVHFLDERMFREITGRNMKKTDLGMLLLASGWQYAFVSADDSHFLLGERLDSTVTSKIAKKLDSERPLPINRKDISLAGDMTIYHEGQVSSGIYQGMQSLYQRVFKN